MPEPPLPLQQLPAVEEVTSEHIGAIHALKATYDGFSYYQRALVNEETTNTYNKLVEKYNELMAEAEEEVVEEENLEAAIDAILADTAE